MVKAAIIGCGKIAQVRHIPEYLEHRAVNLVGFYDLNEKRAEELAEKYGGKAYGSVEELLADPQIDAVSICTANHTHAELTIKALKAGKHVLCEKPMAITLEECQRMVECAEENHRKLLIGQNQRLTRTHQIARKLIADGEIGNVLSFQTSFQHSGPESWSVDAGKNTWFFQKKAAAMGVMGDLGIHKTRDIITGRLSQPPEYPALRKRTSFSPDPLTRLRYGTRPFHQQFYSSLSYPPDYTYSLKIIYI